ncbi:NlpC/P60 family protein [bacterium 210820-DFI.6.37]|nr:NlpC/P60 family protein [bacterium 210820-DFI.6.37]
MVTVTTTEKVSKSEAIDYKTQYKETSKLYIGEEKVVTKGKKGKKTIVSEVVKENGKTVSKEEISETVDKEPTTKVIQKGTKTMTASKASAVVSRGGTAMGRGSGQDVVNYALQFVGNPYVYGGSSLTNGTDCSGFTMSVYAKFGISLPHSSSAQRSCGKGVSYSEAKPGDIICYAGHVAIYIGNGKIVHASTPSTGIKVGSATYKKIITVRRIIE